jgi:hypothetical protein
MRSAYFLEEVVTVIHENVPAEVKRAEKPAASDEAQLGGRDFRKRLRVRQLSQNGPWLLRYRIPIAHILAPLSVGTAILVDAFFAVHFKDTAAWLFFALFTSFDESEARA